MAIDSQLRALQIPMICAGILTAAFFQARGVGQLVAGHLVPREPVLLKPHSVDPVAERDKSATDILSRNPFDSVTGPLNKQAGTVSPITDTPTQPVSNGDPYDDSPCANVRASLITATDDPAWSFAALTTSDGETMRRIGDKVGTQTVEHIGYYESPNHGTMPRVWLVNGGQRCIVPDTGPDPTVKKPTIAEPRAPSAKNSKKAKLEAEVKSKITKIAENHYEVDKSGVEIIMQHYAKLAGSIRARGTKEGMRISGIRPDSVLGEIGMQNGDLLSDINGFDMSDPEKAVDAYAKLRKAGKLDMTMMRDGAPVTIKIQIK